MLIADGYHAALRGAFGLIYSEFTLYMPARPGMAARYWRPVSIGMVAKDQVQLRRVYQSRHGILILFGIILKAWCRRTQDNPRCIQPQMQDPSLTWGYQPNFDYTESETDYANVINRDKTCCVPTSQQIQGTDICTYVRRARKPLSRSNRTIPVREKNRFTVLDSARIH